jgi:myo-inositol-1(or 4)-monophosphatase
MNAWDCLAALLLIEEAGGKIVRPDAQTAVANGAMVIAGGAGVFGALEALVKDPFGR